MASIKISFLKGKCNARLYRNYLVYLPRLYPVPSSFSFYFMCMSHCFAYLPTKSLKYIFICKVDSAIFIFQNTNGQKYYTRETHYIWFYIYTMMNFYISLWSRNFRISWHPCTTVIKQTRSELTKLAIVLNTNNLIFTVHI